MEYYFVQFPTKWGKKPQFFKGEEKIESAVRDYVANLKSEFSYSKQDKERESVVDELFIQEQDNIPKQSGKPIDRDKFIREHHFLIEERVEKNLFEKVFKTKYRSLKPFIEKIDITSCDMDGIYRLENLANKYGVPDLYFGQALNKQKTNLEWEGSAKEFYKSAKVTNSVFRGAPGTLKLSKKYQKLLRIRYYKDQKGAIRQTVEIEINARS